MTTKELVEVTVLEVFDSHEQGLLEGAETEDAGDVRVLQHGEETNLANKFRPRKKQEVRYQSRK